MTDDSGNSDAELSAEARAFRESLGGPFPEHVAIIMDGNGRWAEERGWMRVRGHKVGTETVRTITTAAADLGREEPHALRIQPRELEAPGP